MTKLTARAAGALLLAIGLGGFAPGAALAQKPALGEVAKKEQERRKALKSTDKVLTAKDLPPGTPRPAPVPAPQPGEPAGQPAGQPAGADASQEGRAQEDERDEAWWRERIARAQEGLRRSESFLEALQTRVNVLSADFASRDDPAQRARIAEDRQKALAEMERVAAEIAAYKKQIEDIHEEARKAGVPPGWLR